MSAPTNKSEARDQFREQLIDKLDDQRFGDNVVNKKLLYKDIEWIIDELLPAIDQYTAGEKVEADRLARIDELSLFARTFIKEESIGSTPSDLVAAEPYIDADDTEIIEHIDKRLAELAPHKEQAS